MVTTTSSAKWEGLRRGVDVGRGRHQPAERRERSPERANSRNGYRSRDFDARAGSIGLAVPKLRSGSYFPEWLLEPRRRAEKALAAVVAEAYVAGVSTRRVHGLVQSMGIDCISESQVSEMARSLDSQVEAFRSRPLDAGPYLIVAGEVSGGLLDLPLDLIAVCPSRTLSGSFAQWLARPGTGQDGIEPVGP